MKSTKPSAMRSRRKDSVTQSKSARSRVFFRIIVYGSITIGKVAREVVEIFDYLPIITFTKNRSIEYHNL